MALKYKKLARGIVVYLDGSEVGTIRTVRAGFQYQPKGSRLSGEVFSTLNECKASLQTEAA